MLRQILRDSFSELYSAFEFGWPFGALVWVESVEVSMGARRLLREQGLGKRLNWMLVLMKERTSEHIIVKDQ